MSTRHPLMPGIFFATFGLLMVIFRSQMAHSAVEWNYRILRVRFSKKGYEISFLIGGMFFVVVGILMLFQVIKIR